MKDHLRKSPAHPPPIERLNTPTILFVTVCAKRRARIYDNPAVHAALRSIWLLSQQWRVGKYMIMPDHIHLFCSPKNSRDGEPVKRWCRFWKKVASEAVPEISGGWLKDCWDTQMRSVEMYHEKEVYMGLNPVRAGLVASSEPWKYQGRIKTLSW